MEAVVHSLLWGSFKWTTGAVELVGASRGFKNPLKAREVTVRRPIAAELLLKLYLSTSVNW